MSTKMSLEITFQNVFSYLFTLNIHKCTVLITLSQLLILLSYNQHYGQNKNQFIWGKPFIIVH
jgi:hypothetical protein